MLVILALGFRIDKSQGSTTLVIKGEFNKDDYKDIITSNNQLGFALLPETKENSDGNIFISPSSLLIALSMVYNGADGVTKEEIAKVLHKEGIEAAQLNKANASLMTRLIRSSKGIQLHIANSIWLNKDYHFQDGFTNYIHDYYNAKIEEIDPTSAKTPNIINDWVKQATNGKIEKLIEKDIDPDTVAFLLNAIYFRGDWLNEFDPKLTAKRTFHLKDGTSKQMPLMMLNEKLDYLETGDFQAVNLPYADGKMSMKVFLPKEDSSLEEFEKILTNDSWENWHTGFQKKEGTLFLPKFQLEYEAEWNQVLKKLGMTTAFDKEANFTKMIKENDPLWINKVKQKTFINVNEEGSEAAAATSVQMKTESAPAELPFHMEVNRPFFMAITDDKTGAILFLGSVSNPQTGK